MRAIAIFLLLLFAGGLPAWAQAPGFEKTDCSGVNITLPAGLVAKNCYNGPVDRFQGSSCTIEHFAVSDPGHFNVHLRLSRQLRCPITGANSLQEIKDRSGLPPQARAAVTQLETLPNGDQLSIFGTKRCVIFFKHGRTQTGSPAGSYRDLFYGYYCGAEGTTLDMAAATKVLDGISSTY